MQKNKIYLIGAILVLATAATLAYFKLYLPHKYAKLTEKILTNALARMDDDTLAGQAIHIAIPGTALNDQNRKVITALKPGGIIFFGFNLETAEQIKKFTGDLQNLAAELKLPPFLISTDQEGGYVRRVRDGVLQTPPAMDLGLTGDSELCRATGYYVSQDLGAIGINVFFAPIVDINNNPKNPVIGLRSFGTTIDAVLKCALPFEAGARLAYEHSGGAIPVIKHFPGHGDTQVDSHWALPVIVKSLDELRNFELVPFREAIKGGAMSVMTAHILYPQIDKDAPATLSKIWLGQMLRTELAFKGLVFTDAMEMRAVSEHYKEMNRPVTALEAGADVLLYTSWQDDPPEAKARITEALKSNPAPVKRAVVTQLAAKLAYLDIKQYLPADEAEWYRRYRANVLKSENYKLPAMSKAALTGKFADIPWSKKIQKGGPRWLAGRKN